MRRSTLSLAAFTAVLVLGVPAPSSLFAAQVACGCCLTCRPNIQLLGCKNLDDCETCCEAWQQRLCMGVIQQAGGMGGIFTLPEDRLLLVVTPNDKGQGHPDGREVLRFLIPDDVTLEPGVYGSREELEDHLIDRFVGAVPSPPAPPAPTLQSCMPGVRYAPEVHVVRRPAGPVSRVVAIAGVDLGDGAIPSFGGRDAAPLYGGMLMDVPLAGVVYVGFTEYAEATSWDVVEVTVTYCAATSEAKDFANGQCAASGKRFHEDK